MIIVFNVNNVKMDMI